MLLCWLSLLRLKWRVLRLAGGRRRPHRGVVLQDVRLRVGHRQQQCGHRVVGVVCLLPDAWCAHPAAAVVLWVLDHDLG